MESELHSTVSRRRTRYNLMVTDNRALDRRLLSPSIFSDPYPVYHQLRAEDPVHWSDAWGCWVLTRYKDVVSVLHDYRRFSNVGRIPSFLDQLPESMRSEIRPLYDNFSTGMPNTDPPDHTRIRSLVNRAFGRATGWVVPAGDLVQPHNEDYCVLSVVEYLTALKDGANISSIMDASSCGCKVVVPTILLGSRILSWCPE